MDSFFIFGAEYLYLISILVALVYFFSVQGEVKKKILKVAVIALPLAYLVSLIAGALYYNPQPFVVGNFEPLIADDIENGFPSHHTLLVAAVASAVVFFSRRVGALLWFIALVVGVSRVYVGVHHVEDIVASMLIALISTWVVIWVYKKRHLGGDAVNQ